MQLQERTLDKLILENDDYIFAGDLTINGDVNIKNGSLIVSGTITFVRTTATISITGGDISCNELNSCSPIVIRDGDIYTKNLYANVIDSDGDIIVSEDVIVDTISCLNYMVSGNNNSCCIITMQDVYISGENDSYNIMARDVLICGNNNSRNIKAHEVVIEGYCDTNGHGITAKKFYCKGKIYNCSSMAIG